MAPMSDEGRDDDQPVGLPVPEVASRYRVGTQKVLSWIRRGDLTAINTSASLAARPRFVALLDALLAFEKARIGQSCLPGPPGGVRRPKGPIFLSTRSRRPSRTWPGWLARRRRFFRKGFLPTFRPWAWGRQNRRE
jgi:hypothetical protein